MSQRFWVNLSVNFFSLLCIICAGVLAMFPSEHTPSGAWGWFLFVGFLCAASVLPKGDGDSS